MDRELLYRHLARLCSMREYCKSDILRKIAAASDENIDAQEIISQLCTEKYLDEKRYAAAFARDKSALQGWGIQKIRAALQAKRVDKEAVEYGLQQIEPEKASNKLRSVLEAKYRTLSGEPQKMKEALLRFGLGRGYSYEEILREYDSITSNKND